jgi:hypothetical protein
MRANAMVWSRRGVSLVLAVALLAGCAGVSLPDLFAKPVTLRFVYLSGAIAIKCRLFRWPLDRFKLLYSFGSNIAQSKSLR